METELDLQTTASDALEYSRALEVKNQESLNLANKAMVRIGQTRKGIIAYFADPKTKAKAAHQAIVDKEKDALKPLKEAEDILKPRIGTYVMTQRRIQEEAERRAREEEERKKREAEEAINKAVELENEGKAEEALDKLKEAEEMEERKPAAAMPAAPVMSGTHTVTYTRWRVINEKEIPRRFLMLDKSTIDAEVMKYKMKTKIAGIQVYEETDVRRGRS